MLGYNPVTDNKEETALSEAENMASVLGYSSGTGDLKEEFAGFSAE